MRLRTMPDELRDNWGRAYQWLCVKDPSPTYVTLMAKFQEQAGITDRLIVHFLERAIKDKRRNYLAWISEVLTECAANGITSPDEWETFDSRRDEGGKQGERPKTSQSAPGRENIATADGPRSPWESTK